MNSAYNFNLHIKPGQLLIKATLSGSLEWPLYRGLTVFTMYLFYLSENVCVRKKPPYDFFILFMYSTGNKDIFAK